MRRGAAPSWFYRLGEWRLAFSCLRFFVPLPSCSALMLPLERMISHVFPWTFT